MNMIRDFPGFLPILIAGLLLPLQAGAETGEWLTDPIGGCKIWTDQQDSFRETATWIGDCVDGKASGEGVLVWFKDDNFLGRYVGSMRAGKLHGKGVLHYRPPDKIDAMKADVKDKTLDDGELVYHYEGVMKNGELDGRGMLYYRSNRGYDRYEGTFVDGEGHGDFTVTRADGSSETPTLDHGQKVEVEAKK